MKISNILARYNCDKVTTHCYGDVYDKIFGKFDQNKELNILEIGVEKGGSIMAWTEYFPKGHVYGIDIVDSRLPEYKTDKATFILEDVNNIKLDKKFDIIIDDGSHRLPDVICSVKKFLPQLNKNGVMIVEDVQHPKSWVWETAKLAGLWRLLTGKFYYKDLRKINNGFDDFLIIIKK